MPKDNEFSVDDILNELDNKTNQNIPNSNPPINIISHEKKNFDYDLPTSNFNENKEESTKFIPSKTANTGTKKVNIDNDLATKHGIDIDFNDNIDNLATRHTPVNRTNSNKNPNHQNKTMTRRSNPNSPNQPNLPRKKKKKKKRRTSLRVSGVLILTTLIFAVSITLALVIITYGKDMLGIGKNNSTHLIVIPEGANTVEISLMLEEEGIINSPKFFQMFSKLSGSDTEYIPGEHFVRPNMAYETIIEELTSIMNEDGEEVVVTFPEGISIVDAARILEEKEVCSADEFIFFFNSGGYGFDFEERIPNSILKFYAMEGYVFPDTYYFYTNTEVEQVCQKIYSNFNNKMTEERYAKMESLNLTLDQLITFASIVQAEASTKDSMTMVASVFWNRLNNPDIFPLLQSDPTTYYANDVIRPHLEVYDQALLDSYDTYTSAGLPPGPIGNPGIDAIDAVLANFQSDYFYFYANINTGQTYFAATLEEHYANEELIKQQIADAKAAEEEEE